MDAGDREPDSTADGGGARWMSFAELGAARGISKASAIKLVRRHGWRRQRDNQGHVRALVPLTWAEGDRAGERDSLPDSTPDNQPDTGLVAGALAALETAVLSLTERALAAERRADSAEAVIAGERARADRAETDRTDERLRADDLRDRLIKMQQQLADAHATLQEAEASDARGAEAVIAAALARADDLQAGQELMMDMHARAQAALQGDLDMARAQATTAHDALRAVRQAQAERKGRGLLARLRAAVRGE